MKRWLALLGVALLLGVGAGLGLWYQPRAADRAATVAGFERLRADAETALGAPAADSTYAYIVGPRGAAWVELLCTAGVPVPRPVATAAEVPEDARLVVLTAGASAIDGSALAAPGRVVLVAPATDAPDPDAFVPDPQHPGRVVTLGSDWAARAVRLRQGDPSLADRDTDGNGDIQPADLLGPESRRTNSAEADLRLQRALDTLGAEAGCPLPRTRGLPAGVEALVVLTADQDYNPDALVEPLATQLGDLGATATHLLTNPALGRPADLHVASAAERRNAPTLSAGLRDTLLADGSGLGIHPFTADPAEITAVAEAFAADNGFRPLTARNHHVLWSGYVQVPRAEAAAGVRLNLDALPICRGEAPCAGFLAGYGQPMRFIDETGAALPIWQQPTTVDDYSLRVSDEAARAAAGAALTQRALALLAEAARAEAPLVVNAHPNLVVLGHGWLTPVLVSPPPRPAPQGLPPQGGFAPPSALLMAPGVRVVSAETWLDFVVRRRLARITLADCGAPRVSLPPGVALRGLPAGAR
jgi:hypothetical protein